MSKHTSGPWVIYPETDGTEICAVKMESGLPIRQIIAHLMRGDNWIANGRLIAAAPELLKSLIEILPMAKDSLSHPDLSVEILDAIAAISKATGETA